MEPPRPSPGSLGRFRNIPRKPRSDLEAGKLFTLTGKAVLNFKISRTFSLCFFVFCFENFFGKWLVCSTSPPRGIQVDGLPRVVSEVFARLRSQVFDHYEYHLEVEVARRADLLREK